MSGINQIQMSFNPAEDRILLRMNTVDAAGFQFWLTRRYVRLLWPVLLGMLAKDEQITTQRTDMAKNEVLSFQQQDAVQKMDYSQEFTAESARPLGDVPLLLEKIAVNDRENGEQVLCMHPSTGQGVELALNQTLLHSICKLLQDTASKADWDLDLPQSLSTPASVVDTAPRTIN